MVSVKFVSLAGHHSVDKFNWGNWTGLLCSLSLTLHTKSDGYKSNNKSIKR